MLEQLEFKLKKIIVIQKPAGKFIKEMLFLDCYFYFALAFPLPKKYGVTTRRWCFIWLERFIVSAIILVELAET